jgi:hypothetical protein
LRFLRSTGLAALLLLTMAPLAGRPVLAEFTDAGADARSFHPLRLTADLGGRERQAQLAFDFPAGGRIEPAIAEMTVGGRIHVRILSVYIPSGTGAGAYTVRGRLTDGTQRWPFEATINVRANPRMLVRDEDVGFTTVRSEETVRRSWRVSNTGNVVLDLRTSTQPTEGVVITVEPAALTLGPGEQGEIVLTARLERAPDRLVTLPLFLNVDSGVGVLHRRETVGFTAEFVPVAAGTGPLYAELTGEVLFGGFRTHGRQGYAGRLRLEGEVGTGVKLLAYGADGTDAPGGSHLGLTVRDFLTVELASPVWRATGGRVSPPAFGFLETSTQGLGGTLARTNGNGLTLTALATQDHYADFSREHAGLHLAYVNSDQSGWEAGLLAQRNQSGPEPEQQRLGGFAQADWRWQSIAGSSQVAVARDPVSHDPRFGLEQRLDYRPVDNLINAALFVQTAPTGFFLDGRSQQMSDATLGLAAGESGRLNLHWSEAKETGLLRSYNQNETEAGLTPTDPEFVELVTRNGSAVRTWSTGYAFPLGDSRAQLAFADTERTRETGVLTVPGDTYRERTITADWSNGLQDGRLFLTATLSTGTEDNLSQQSDFAEAAFTAGGIVGEHLQFSSELRHTWQIGGSPNTGYRQPGTYGRGSLIWTPRPRWRVEAGLDGYQFSKYSGRVRSYAVLELPLSRRLSLATEVSHDGESTSCWLALRVRFTAAIPWRPLRGALTGHLRESGSGTPLAGARLDLGGNPGLTGADGRFTLPGRIPGTYPLTWDLPPGYLAAADWPRTVEIHAGEVQSIELAAQRLGLLTGTIEITRGGEVERPTGPISATDEAGQLFETMAAAGDFTLRLPPGRYVVQYRGELTEELAAQLAGPVTVGPQGESVTVHLAATEVPREMRRTLLKGDAPPVRRPKGS